MLKHPQVWNLQIKGIYASANCNFRILFKICWPNFTKIKSVPCIFSTSWYDKKLNLTFWINLEKCTWLDKLSQVTFLKKVLWFTGFWIALIKAFHWFRFQMGECSATPLPVFLLPLPDKNETETWQTGVS